MTSGEKRVEEMARHWAFYITDTEAGCVVEKRVQELIDLALLSGRKSGIEESKEEIKRVYNGGPSDRYSPWEQAVSRCLELVENLTKPEAKSPRGENNEKA